MSKTKRKTTGAKSRRKGAYHERRFAQLIGGKKISRSGYGGPDVQAADGTLWEVKFRGEGANVIFEALNQHNNVTHAAIKIGRKPWVVCMYLDDYLQEKAPQ